MIKIADLPLAGTGSQFTSTHFNTIRAKINTGTDSVYAGSVTVSGTVNKVLSPIGTGSPVAWGKWCQYGSGTTSAGSVLWVVFGLPFPAVPKMMMSSWDDGAPVTFVGSPVNAGSVRVVSEGASQIFSWVAYG